MSSTWEPIGHHPPMPRIETNPNYTPAPIDTVPEHMRLQIEHIEATARAREGERVWQAVVETARAT